MIIPVGELLLERGALIPGVFLRTQAGITQARQTSAERIAQWARQLLPRVLVRACPGDPIFKIDIARLKSSTRR